MTDDTSVKQEMSAAAMKFIRLLLLLVPVCACIIEANAKESRASVVLDSDGKTLIIKAGYDSSQSMVAWGTFRDRINSSGWASDKYSVVHSSLLNLHISMALKSSKQLLAYINYILNRL